MNQLSLQTAALLKQSGAALVGFADLRQIANSPLPYGVSVAIALPAQLVRDNANATNKAYDKAYYACNETLDRLARLGAGFLQGEGYQALPLTTVDVDETTDFRTPLPYKTVATQAGLGWIGKNALLVTEEYGSAVRLTAILTDAPLDCAVPITASRCGGCQACRNICPAGAISGELWTPQRDRDSFYNLTACRETARALAVESIQKVTTLCLRCVAACPYTARYLKRAAQESL